MMVEPSITSLLDLVLEETLFLSCLHKKEKMPSVK